MVQSPIKDLCRVVLRRCTLPPRLLQARTTSFGPSVQSRFTDPKNPADFGPVHDPASWVTFHILPLKEKYRQ